MERTYDTSIENKRREYATKFLAEARNNGRAITEDEMVHFQEKFSTLVAGLYDPRGPELAFMEIENLREGVKSLGLMGLEHYKILYRMIDKRSINESELNSIINEF